MGLSKSKNISYHPIQTKPSASLKDIRSTHLRMSFVGYSTSAHEHGIYVHDMDPSKPLCVDVQRKNDTKWPIIIAAILSTALDPTIKPEDVLKTQVYRDLISRNPDSWQMKSELSPGPFGDKSVVGNMPEDDITILDKMLAHKHLTIKNEKTRTWRVFACNDEHLLVFVSREELDKLDEYVTSNIFENNFQIAEPMRSRFGVHLYPISRIPSEHSALTKRIITLYHSIR